MQLKIYNTLTRQKEDFIPLMDDPNYKGPPKDFVWLYSCGPTVYRNPSIGNYRATFTADLIRNTLKLLWYNVKSVMNITDVGHLVSDADEGEDKLEKWSKREGISAWDVAKKYEEVFKEGMKALNIDEFDIMPRATEHIPEQIALIQTLEEKWYTYTVENDGIYMDTTKVENYGELMWANYKKRLADLNAGERIEMWGKKHPTDFALRKFSPVNERRQMERDSPWGKWFPGWHIECSAMSSKYLGQQFDIHHGWADHITIHHPNEIAQSECAFDVHPRVKYWVHNEFLQVDWGKMSKSLGNVYNLEDIKAKWFSPLDLRYFYFMAQYGSFQNFTREILDQTAAWFTSLKKDFGILCINFLEKEKIIQMEDKIYSGIPSCIEFRAKYLRTIIGKEMSNTMIDALLNNFDSPNVLSIVRKYINLARNRATFRPNEVLGTDEIIDIINNILYLDEKILKLNLFEYVKSWLIVGQTEENLTPIEINDLANQRVQAKKSKDFKLADELRNEINLLWREIKDTKEWYELSKI